jgi:pimeloyl-ACP methyl ester carboxylesterase
MSGPAFFQRDDGVALAYRATTGSPHAPTLVFLPGFRSDMTGDKATALAAIAASAGFPSLRLDYSGHGASGGDFETGTISMWRDDALLLIDRLTSGDIVLVGSSMGGWIGLLIALLRPARIKAFIGIAAAADFARDLMWPSLPEEARETIMRDGVWRTESPYGGETIITRALIEDGIKNCILDSEVKLNIPVRLLQGMRDEDVPWTTALQIADKMTGEDVRITLIKDGDHRLSRPQDIALLCATVSDILLLAQNGA